MTVIQRWKFLLSGCLLLSLIGCQTTRQVHQAQRQLKTLVQTSVPLFEQNHIALLRCSNGAGLQKIKQAITQTKRAVDRWFADQPGPRKYTSRLLIFAPDEPLGQQLIKEMRATNHVAGNTEARTHTILIAGDPQQDDFWTTLRHELAHDAMLRHYDTVEDLPPFWVTEGLATVFETPAEADGQPAINPARSARLQAVIQQGKLNLLPLITQVADQNADSIAYAQAWGLTFYLLRQQPTAVRQYLADYQHAEYPTSAVHQMIFERLFQKGQPFNKLNNSLKRWVLLQKFN